MLDPAINEILLVSPVHQPQLTSRIWFEYWWLTGVSLWLEWEFDHIAGIWKPNPVLLVRLKSLYTLANPYHRFA